MVSFRLATANDLEALLELQQRYYAEDGYPFVQRTARDAWEPLLKNSNLGCVWVAEDGVTLVAYAVLTFGYSLEYHGRTAVLDELFVALRHRRRGLGREALQVLETTCRSHGVRALHLVAEHTNVEALQLYRTHGFVNHGRCVMTQRFDVEPSDDGGRGLAGA